MSNAPEINRPTRRQLMLGTLGAGGLLAVGAPAPARAAAARPTPSERRWTGRRSANGWTIDGRFSTFGVEGAGLKVELRPGPVSVVLLHVARRFHYEVDTLRSGDLVGAHRDRLVVTPEQSNHLSGTALAIRGGSYPAGSRGNLFPDELVVVRDIVAECDGIVTWGGDLVTAQEGHFEISVGPASPGLVALAAQLESLDDSSGQGAGSTDAFDPARRRETAEFYARRRRR